MEWMLTSSIATRRPVERRDIRCTQKPSIVGEVEYLHPFSKRVVQAAISGIDSIDPTIGAHRMLGSRQALLSFRWCAWGLTKHYEAVNERPDSPFDLALNHPRPGHLSIY